MFLKKTLYTSPASRNITKLTSNWLSQKKFNPLTWRSLSRAGCGMFGRRVTFSKGALLVKRRLPSINYSFRYKILSVITTLQLIPFQNKLVALCFLATGGVSYLPATNHFKIFRLVTYRSFGNLSNTLPNNPLSSLLLNLKLLSRISLLELYPGSKVQYVRSSGSYAKFIRIDWINHTGIVELPSKIRKAFSLYSVTSLGPVALRDKRLMRNTKAGFWRSYGSKSQVRGVAMNPIDHPHGGRTKAIKKARTPWGKITKKK